MSRFCTSVIYHCQLLFSSSCRPYSLLCHSMAFSSCRSPRVDSNMASAASWTWLIQGHSNFFFSTAGLWHVTFRNKNVWQWGRMSSIIGRLDFRRTTALETWYHQQTLNICCWHSHFMWNVCSEFMSSARRLHVFTHYSRTHITSAWYQWSASHFVITLSVTC